MCEIFGVSDCIRDTDDAIKTKTTTRSRNKSGRVTSVMIKMTHDLLPSESTPTPPSLLPELYPEEAVSEDEMDHPVLQTTRKRSSWAVSVSLNSSGP